MTLLNECFFHKLTSTLKNRLRYYDTTESEPSKVWYKGSIRYNYNVWIPHAKPSLRTQVLFLGTRMRAVQLSGGKPDEYGLPQWSARPFLRIPDAGAATASRVDHPIFFCSRKVIIFAAMVEIQRGLQRQDQFEKLSSV